MKKWLLILLLIPIAIFSFNLNIAGGWTVGDYNALTASAGVLSGDFLFNLDYTQGTTKNFRLRGVFGLYSDKFVLGPAFILKQVISGDTLTSRLSAGAGFVYKSNDFLVNANILYPVMNDSPTIADYLSVAFVYYFPKPDESNFDDDLFIEIEYLYDCVFIGFGWQGPTP